MARHHDMETIKYEGYCIDILDKLASELKFTYEIHPSPDGSYGSKIDGQWSGVIGDLINKVWGDFFHYTFTVDLDR